MYGKAWIRIAVSCWIRIRIGANREPNLWSIRFLLILMLHSGFESIDEYVDNRHPVWSEIKVAFRDYLHDARLAPHFLADWVHLRWRSGHRIDLNRNLSCFPRQRANRIGEKISFFTFHNNIS